MPEEKIGKVTHFFAKPMVAAFLLEATLKVGDTLHITGHSTDFTFQVDSMQIERSAVESADAGAEVGVQVPERARDGDDVFKVTED